MNVIERCSQLLLSAHRTGEPVSLDGLRLETADQAYDVQQRVAAALGPVGGFKVAARAGAMPTMAPILASGIVPSGARVPATGQIGIELETGFRVLDPAPLLAGAEREEIVKCVVPVLVLELVATRLAPEAASDAMAKLADFQTNMGLVVGPEAPDWDGSDIGALAIELSAGSAELDLSSAEVPGGSALRALAALAGMIGDHCGGLQPGHVVITGSLHPMIHVDPPTTIRGTAAGFGAISVTLEPASPASRSPAM